MSYAALDIFQQLRQEDIHWMLASAELRTVSANGVLVREDDPSDTIFFIADGLFEVYVFGAAGARMKVGQLGPGEIIGEISWLDRKPISASVRALEASSVIALGIASLERKLAADTAFAARLFRAIATLTAERLRVTTAQVRRSEHSDRGSLTPDGDAAASAVAARVGELKRLVAGGSLEGNARPAPSDAAAAIGRVLSAIENDLGPQGLQNPGKVAETIRPELLPLLRLSDTAQRIDAKPRGYAGDYQTIEAIYNETPSGKGEMGRVLDGCMLDLPVARAIRNRRRLMSAEIVASYAAVSKEYFVASLACGPAAEVFDAFAKAPDKSRLHASCIDIDREALTQVAARATELRLTDQVRTLHGNLIYLATGRQQLDLAAQDLIFSLNLADYLSDELIVTLIDWIHDKLRPGGRVILGNFHPRNPSRGLMEHVLDWRLIHRDEAAMNQVFSASKFAKPCTRISSGEEGIFLLAECVK
jgi:extracellular factor (EF) 3-hydroxypalmitic acid methyl ester biosynthesis protein